jgi:hypothetical protein
MIYSFNKDEKINNIKHIIRYNILKQNIDVPQDHLRLDLHYTGNLRKVEISNIFYNMFKWLDKLDYLKNIKEMYFNIELEFTSHKGCYWLIVGFQNRAESDSNHYIKVYHEGCGEGTNEIIFNTLTKIIFFNNAVYNSESDCNKHYNLLEDINSESIKESVYIEYRLDD